MLDILMVVGSESGTAEMVADVLVDKLRAGGHRVTMLPNGAGALDANLNAQKLVLVCSSTTGIGDIPQSARKLYEELSTLRPQLGHLSFGIVGLGDRNYKESFNGGPKKWEALLVELGAKGIGTRLELDATDNPTPDEDACVWLPGWLLEAERALG